MREKPPTSHEVLEWPEFQAFAARLGIDLSKPTTKLAITLTFGVDGMPPQVEQHWYAKDVLAGKGFREFVKGTEITCKRE